MPQTAWDLKLQKEIFLSSIESRTWIRRELPLHIWADFSTVSQTSGKYLREIETRLCWKEEDYAFLIWEKVSEDSMLSPVWNAALELPHFFLSRCGDTKRIFFISLGHRENWVI